MSLYCTLRPFPNGSRVSPSVDTSNRPVDDWGKLLGETATVTSLLDRLLHHAHVLTCGPRSWRTKLQVATDSAVTASR
jgi:DNA replication protein DnaC